MNLTDLPNFAGADIWLSLLTLTFLEIVLGIDNIIFIAITSSKLPEEKQKKATNIGLILAMGLRILLLLGISIIIAMSDPFYTFKMDYMSGAFTGQSVILILGGLFLLYKSTTEIHHKLEGDKEEREKSNKALSLSSAIMQITLINIVFSFDSILTAVGMTNGMQGALIIMIIAIVLSVAIMMAFATPVSKFVNNHPTIQMLGMSFLILIGFMLIAEGSHGANLEILGQHVGAIPKGYLYFAIAFSLMVEFLNIKMRKKGKVVHLYGPGNEEIDS
jgi:predicted tellurium resistance membrane protein TerC